jgi:DNA-binding transcriptional LysR family regulator
MNVELRHLRYFIAVAEELNYGQAARRLCVSTPTLSQQIKALEREIGAALFDRDNRQVRLTPVGEVLLGEARTALHAVDEAMRLTRRSAGLDDPVIRLGLLNGVSPHLVVGLERLTARTLPGVRQVHTGGPTSEQLTLLQRHKLDIGFVRLPIEPTQQFGTMIVVREELGVLMTSDHPLAGQEVIDPSALKGQELIWFAEHLAPGFHRSTITSLLEAGADLRVSETTVPQAHLKRVLALRGNAIGLGTRRAAQPPEFQWRPIAGMPVAMEVAAAWLEPVRSETVQRLLHALAQAVRKDRLMASGSSVRP